MWCKLIDERKPKDQHDDQKRQRDQDPLADEIDDTIKDGMRHLRGVEPNDVYRYMNCLDAEKKADLGTADDAFRGYIFSQASNDEHADNVN